MNPPVRRSILAACIAVGALLAACSAPVGGSASIGTAATGTAGSSTSPTIAPSAAGTGPAITSPAGDAPIPAGLEEFYRQQLDWGSCADLATSDDTKFYRSGSLQCAELTVPLSYDDPTGPTIQLKVLRKQATDPANRIGSVIVNPGGPGGSGVEAAGSYAGLGIAAAPNERFDFVGFDPRGVGASAPEIRCQTDSERDADRAANLRTRTPEGVGADDEESERFAQGCAALTGQPQGIDGTTFLATVGTPNVAKDLDVLRAALGDAQLSYIGWSYGTAIGTSYATQFPQNVRAMILDGAVDPNQDAAGMLIGQAEGFQRAFEDFAAWCAEPDQTADQPCPLGSDPSEATENYQDLVRPLLDRPLSLADGRVLTFDDATTGTVQALYAEGLWQPLFDALNSLAAGDGSELMGLADYYHGRDARGRYSNFQDAFTAISCRDGFGIVPKEDLLAVAEKYAAAAPFISSGDPPAVQQGLCEFWPVPVERLPAVDGVPGLPQVLVISTTHDPATPYENGVNLAAALGARLLTVEGSSHTAYLGDNSCANQIGTDYLNSLTVPADGTTC